MQARSIASCFSDVDELAAAVVALARIAFRVFVGQHRPLRLEHGARDDVFRGDELDLVALAAEFELDRAGDLRIGPGERRRKRTNSSGWAWGGDVHRQTFHGNEAWPGRASGRALARGARPGKGRPRGRVRKGGSSRDWAAPIRAGLGQGSVSVGGLVKITTSSLRDPVEHACGLPRRGGRGPCFRAYGSRHAAPSARARPSAREFSLQRTASASN